MENITQSLIKPFPRRPSLLQERTLPFAIVLFVVPKIPKPLQGENTYQVFDFCARNDSYKLQELGSLHMLSQYLV